CQEIQETLEPHVAQDYLENLGCPSKHQIQESLKENNKELFKTELLSPKHDKTNGFGYLAVLLVQGYLVNPSALLVQDLLDILGPTPPDIPRDSPWSPEKGKTITRFLSQQF
ncbi:hypothetical protein E2320_012919, partial [Naja naja]